MQHNDPAAHEAREIDEVTQRLRARYPDIDPDRINAVVTDAHRVFDGGPIRDFVPLFVERAACAALDILSPPDRRPPRDPSPR